MIDNKNLIYFPFCYLPKKNTGVNMSSAQDAVGVYLKNACVAAVSAKKRNPNDDVAFVTNLEKKDILPEILKIWEEHGILYLYVPHDDFIFPDGYLWSLAFYKLCALKHVLEMDYKAISYMDTDVFVQDSFGPIWAECKEHILLYDINHGLQVKGYQIFCKEVNNYLKKDHIITHYGGEFFAANVSNGKKFITVAKQIYNEMISWKFETTRGDEFIISLAADALRTLVKNAGAYIYRFWTGTFFYLVSTNYRYNRIIVLHLPSEKQKGMLKLYERYIARGIDPSDKAVWKILHISHRSFMSSLKETIKLLLKR